MNICDYVNCSVPAEGGKTKRTLIKIVERKLEEMEDKESDDERICQYLRHLLLYVHEVRERSRKDTNISPDQSHLDHSVEQPLQIEHPQDWAHRTLEEKINSLGDKLASLNHQQSEVRHSTPHYVPMPEVTLRREFKINGQIGGGGQKDKLSYTSLVHQIDSGLRKGYSEAEIVEAVIRAVNPGLHL